MMHVLNGEGTAGSFRNSGIKGSIIVWNELLVDGPVTAPLFSKEFFRLRTQYINQLYEPDSYEEVVLAEFLKLQPVKAESVTLWFEYDLFCQVNLVALLTWLKDRDLDVFLVCIDRHPDHLDFRGLGQLNPAQLAALYPNRKLVSTKTKEYASQIWEAYCSDNPEDLLAYTFHEEACPQLPFLQRAFLEHFRRFPSSRNGLNYIQNQIITLATQKYTGSKLIQELIIRNHHLGYGDLQYNIELNRINQFVRSDGSFVTTTGIVPAHENCAAITNGRTLGGAQANGWLWDEASLSLIPTKRP